MRPQLLKVSQGPGNSFSIRRDLVPHVNNHWHYHEEVELIHFKQGAGTQFVGDSIKRFSINNVVLIGENLPHFWRFDDGYFDNFNSQADVRVVHFNKKFLGEQFLELPENNKIKTLLETGKRGIQVEGYASYKVAGLLEDMLEAEGADRIILLIQALSVISKCNDLKELSSVGFRHSYKKIENERINAIYDFSIKNFKRKISLDEISLVANISPHSFCRYFKSSTNKTFSKFLLELKVGHACRLLIENKLSIKQICFESGFNNFASFHKYFKMIKGKSPGIYQREFKSGLS